MQMTEFKICPTCGAENHSFAQLCKDCNRHLENVLITRRLPTVPPANPSASFSEMKLAPETKQLPHPEDTIKVGAPSHPENTPTMGLTPIPPLLHTWNRFWHRAIASSSVTKQRRFGIIYIASLLLLIFAIIALLLVYLVVPSINKNSSFSKPIVRITVPDGLGEFKAANGDTIGVNDGTFAPFDMWRNPQELALKQQGAQKVRAGHEAGAITAWNSALKIDSSDAEALIYEENQRVVASGKPYFTLIACTAFVTQNDNSPQNQLQGIYVAQHELNSSSSLYGLRILIANSGNDENNAQLIAQQIVDIAKKDHTVVGTVGWLTSSRSYTSLTTLSDAKIPQVSPQASEDKLSGISPYFFRVAPANRVEAPAAAKFAEQTLQVKNPVVFVDPNDPYSQNLAQDFEDQFVKDRHGQRPYEETFTTDDKNNKAKFVALIQDALKHNPDAFYFTSPSVGDTGLFQDALPTNGPFATLPVISGDAGYVVHPKSYNRWFFTSFAFADAWNLIEGKENNTPFFQDYSSDFNPDGLKPGGYYGFTRPDDTVMLSYDATQVLLKGIQIALSYGKTTLATLTSQDVAAALPKITGAQAYPGVSGQIAFDANHDPINKAVVFLYTTADGHLQMKSYQGCFIKGCP